MSAVIAASSTERALPALGASWPEAGDVISMAKS
jgi:hypothetical protein